MMALLQNLESIMKKILLSISLSLCLYSSFSAATPNKNLDYAPVNATAYYPGEGQPNVIQSDSANYYTVQITVTDIYYSGAGINITHCGSTSHINSNSSVLCPLNSDNKRIEISSDTPGKNVTISYQIEK